MKKVSFYISTCVSLMVFYIYIVRDYFYSLQEQISLMVLHLIFFPALIVAFLTRPKGGIYKSKKQEFVYTLLFFGSFVSISVILMLLGGESNSGIGLNNWVMGGLMISILWQLYRELKNEKQR
ncbi:hypothetical protein [Amphibacillus sediminis]|uniref:hypothetical protein n=1 Tax=Amphibacillus sediminis TaxID=360185 RepID=UPI00082A8C13|nr:hypothetical protein [Amphibacillus sediminis]